jgi:hypothetical protein
MEKCTNQVSPDVGSNRSSNLLVESQMLLLLLSFRIWHRSLLSSRSTDIFPLKNLLFLTTLLAVPVLRVAWPLDRTSALHSCSCHFSEFTNSGLFALPTSPWLPSFLFVVLALFYHLRLLYALSFLKANLPILRCALLCPTLSVVVKSRLPSLRTRRWDTLLRSLRPSLMTVEHENLRMVALGDLPD